MYKIDNKVYTIDSIGVNMETQHVNVKDKRLTSRIADAYLDMENEEGIAISTETKPSKGIPIEMEGGVRCTIKPVKYVNGQEYINIIISAKLLKERYFEGLTKNNIKIIWETLMKEKIIYIDFENFKKARINDIDICQNIYKNEKTNFNKMTKVIEGKTGNKIRYTNRFIKEDNQGIEFNTRKKAGMINPYLKIYNKELELKTKSEKFKELYLKEWETENLIRYEATIKNADMIKRLNAKKIIPKIKTLEDLLNVKQSELNKFLNWSIGKYIKIKTTDMKERNTELNPTDEIIKRAIEMIMKSENDKYYHWELIKILSGEYENTDNKKAIYRNKIRLEKIINYIKGYDDQINEIIEEDNALIEDLKKLRIIQD